MLSIDTLFIYFLYSINLVVIKIINIDTNQTSIGLAYKSISYKISINI